MRQLLRVGCVVMLSAYQFPHDLGQWQDKTDGSNENDV